MVSSYARSFLRLHIVVAVECWQIARVYHAHGLPTVNKDGDCSPYVRITCLDAAVYGDEQRRETHKTRRSRLKAQSFETKPIAHDLQPQWFALEQDPDEYQVRSVASHAGIAGGLANFER